MLIGIMDPRISVFLLVCKQYITSQQKYPDKWTPQCCHMWGNKFVSITTFLYSWPFTAALLSIYISRAEGGRLFKHIKRNLENIIQS